MCVCTYVRMPTQTCTWSMKCAVCESNMADTLCLYSLRAKYGTGTWKNGIHGSDSSETAARCVRGRYIHTTYVGTLKHDTYIVIILSYNT